MQRLVLMNSEGYYAGASPAPFMSLTEYHGHACQDPVFMAQGLQEACMACCPRLPLPDLFCMSECLDCILTVSLCFAPKIGSTLQ